MTQTTQNPTPILHTIYRSLQQESELVVAIFRTALILLAVLAPVMGHGLNDSRLGLQIAVLAAIVYNVLALFVYWRRLRVRGQRQVMILADILMVTAWIYYTWSNTPGDTGSPLFPFYYVVIIISALWFAVPGALTAAGLGAASYLLIVYRLSGHDPFALIDALFSQVIYLFLTATVIGYLVDTHKREREQWTRSQVLLAQYQERFRAAQEMYELLIPATTPQVEGLEIAARWRPALQEGGGDFYDVIRVSDDFAVATIADVSGKYTRGAIKLPLFKAAFLASAQVWDDPGRMLQQVNAIVYPLLQPEMFISACMAMIDLKHHRLLYANAGQDPPIFVRGATHDSVLLETGGMLLGIDQHEVYPTEEQVLNPGDTLCLYTDGITEARNAEGEEFGYPNLLARVQAAVAIGLSAEAIADNIFDAVQQHTRGGSRHDDMTVVVLRYRPADQGHTLA